MVYRRSYTRRAAKRRSPVKKPALRKRNTRTKKYVRRTTTRKTYRRGYRRTSRRSDTVTQWFKLTEGASVNLPLTAAAYTSLTTDLSLENYTVDNNWTYYTANYELAKVQKVVYRVSINGQIGSVSTGAALNVTGGIVPAVSAAPNNWKMFRVNDSYNIHPQSATLADLKKMRNFKAWDMHPGRNYSIRYVPTMGQVLSKDLEATTAADQFTTVPTRSRYQRISNFLATKLYGPQAGVFTVTDMIKVEGSLPTYSFDIWVKVTFKNQSISRMTNTI